MQETLPIFGRETVSYTLLSDNPQIDSKKVEIAADDIDTVADEELREQLWRSFSSRRDPNARRVRFVVANPDGSYARTMLVQKRPLALPSLEDDSPVDVAIANPDITRPCDVDPDRIATRGIIRYFRQIFRR